jgi:mannitol 2-dehydrogenase
VDEAMSDGLFAEYIQRFMERDITPYIPAPPNTDVDAYRETFMERLKNPAISDQLARLCFDGISKIPQFIMPFALAKMQARDDMARIAFFAAAYRQYLRSRRDDSGAAYEVDDPFLTEGDCDNVASDSPADFMNLSCFAGADFSASDTFMGAFAENAANIAKLGIRPALEKMMTGDMA